MSDLSQSPPQPAPAGTKRKSTAGTLTSKRAKTSQVDPFVNTKNNIQAILSYPESFPLPSGDVETHRRGWKRQSRSSTQDPKQISAEAERISNQINRGISKLMAWKPSCKTGSAKYAFDGVWTNPRVFGKVLGLDGSPNFKTKKYTKQEFEELVGSISKDIRYNTLYLTGPVNLRYNPDTGEFKFGGSYGKTVY
ncbi:hypothetical protein OPQ81_011255 [Rhizoctonia solani]|nr:hypothetical protein OPQ81_011255 [Rhizoctonia solani]